MKIAVVTGANRGIGHEVSDELVRRGYRVYYGTREQGVSGNPVESADAAGQGFWLTVDVSSSESVKAAAGFIAEKEERIDVLINNAGVYADKDTSILKADRDHLIASFNTNSLGPVEMVQEFLPLLRKSDDARVINVSSGYGQLNGMSTELPGYCLSKFLLNGITIMLSRKLESEGIVVNSVCPGWVRTDMGGSNASRSVEQGASGIVWLADEVDHNQTSKFFRDGKELDW